MGGHPAGRAQGRALSLSVGQHAPDFTLRDQNGRDVSLAELRADRAVLLVFYPFAFSGICTGELGEIRDDLGRFESEQVTTVAISCDPMFSLRAWADQEGYFFPCCPTSGRTGRWLGPTASSTTSAGWPGGDLPRRPRRTRGLVARQPHGAGA